MASLEFDATGVPPAQPFEVLPPGEYLVEISDSEMKETKSGSGQFLALTLSVLDEEHQNRKLFVNLNLVNSNPKAEDIARRELSAICHATGVMKINDSAELHGRPFRVEVAIEKRKDTGEDQNRVKAYMAAGANAPQPFESPKAPAPVRAAATPAKAAPPWQKAKAA